VESRPGRRTFLNYQRGVREGDVNASDNALAHEATIRTMRVLRRVLDHEAILDILTNGDRMHDEARGSGREGGRP
jgi:hypothetical protein